jgi:glutathione S-transferase
MKLYYSHLSPFTRKVLATAIIAGLFDKIEIIDLMSPSGAFVPTDEFKKANPLAKIPAMVLDNGEAVVDSPVICEYVDSKSVKGSAYPKDEDAYFLQKKFEAIADGCMDAAVLRRYESLRPIEKQSADFDAKQKEKMTLSFQYFESMVSTLGTEVFYIGEISIVSMIGYIDVRFAAENWLSTTPNLKKWYDQVSQNPLFTRTAPKK